MDFSTNAVSRHWVLEKLHQFWMGMILVAFVAAGFALSYLFLFPIDG